MLGYIFHHLCEAIKESKNHKKKNVLYARLQPKLFHKSRLVDFLRVASTHDDLEETHGNILFTSVMANMKLLKNNDIVISEAPLRVTSTKSAYLEDNPIITKHDNPEVIMEFTKMDTKKLVLF